MTGFDGIFMGYSWDIHGTGFDGIFMGYEWDMNGNIKLYQMLKMGWSTSVHWPLLNNSSLSSLILPARKC